MIRINVDKVEYMDDFVNDGERYIEIRYESGHFLRYGTKETCSIDVDVKFCKVSIEELDNIVKFFEPRIIRSPNGGCVNDMNDKGFFI